MKAFQTIIILLLTAGFLHAVNNWDYSQPGIAYLHRTTTQPWDIHILIIDLKNPGLNVETVLSNDQVYGREILSTMASRHGAVAAVNGDFCAVYNGIEQGLTVRNNEILVAPKYRTAIGFSQNMAGTIGMWADRWNWHATMSDSQGNQHDLVMMNLDFNPGWMCLYTDKFGSVTHGNSVGANVMEIVVNQDSIVTSIRDNQTGISIQEGHFVISGREGSADWLRTHITLNEPISLNLKTVPDWHNLAQAVSGGPRFVANGQYYADPKVIFPGGEDFELSYKTTYYDTRQPRSAAGLTVNGDTLILAVVDGRQPAHSVGMTLEELADLMIEFGAVDALQFDSGGSATIFFKNSVRNQPSDGTERAVANSLCVMNTGRFKNIAPEAKIIGFCGESLPDNTADKLIDGRRSRGSGKWVHVENHVHWIELDLMETKPLTHFQILHGFYSGDPDYLNSREFKIYTTTDTNDVWQEDFHVINDRFMERDNLCTYDAPVPVRFVRLEIIEATHLDYENNLRQPEFEIYIADTTTLSIKREEQIIPAETSLFQNYPNPFNATTAIGYRLSAVSQVNLSVYNLIGQRVATLVNESQQAGSYQVEWDATGYASGVYIYRIVTDNGFTDTKKLLLLK